MNFEEKKQKTYTSNVMFLSIMTLLLGFCSLFFGYLALPLAAGFYAALLSVEKKDGRILSYIIPLIPFAVNVIVNKAYYLEAVAFIAVGAIIYFGFDRKKDKAFVSFLATLTVLVFMFLSLTILAFDKLGTIETSALMDFYADLYVYGKTKSVSLLTSLVNSDSSGTYYVFNAFDAIEIYNTMILFLFPLTIVFSFFAVGVSEKILSARIRRIDKNDKRLTEWNFITSPFFAYSYLVLTALSSLSAQGTIGISLSFVSLILMVVYYYMGIKATYAFIRAKRGKKIAVFSLFLAHVVFSSFVPQIISFIGVFYNNKLYKNKNPANTDI